MWPRQVAACESGNKLPHSRICCPDDNRSDCQRLAQEINQRLRLFESARDEGREFLAENKFVVVQLHESQEVLELQIFDRLVIFGKSFGSRLQFLPVNLTKAFLKVPGVEDRS